MNIQQKQKFKLIVGLGNPTKDYQNTRHNVGFTLLDSFSDEYGLSFKKEEKFSSLYTKGEIKIEDNTFNVILVKPTTYMNNSGSAIKKILDFYKLDSKDMIVIHDEVALPLGKIRISVSRSSAGHHGIESIIENIGAKEFTRLRIGIGPDPGGDKRKGYVLENFKKDEKTLLKKVILISCDAIKSVLALGENKAMDKFNGLVIT